MEKELHFGSARVTIVKAEVEECKERGTEQGE